MHERPRPSPPPAQAPEAQAHIPEKPPRGAGAPPGGTPGLSPALRAPPAGAFFWLLASGFWLLASASGFFWGAGNREQGTRTRRTRHKTTHYTPHKARARQPPPGARSQEQIALFNSSLSHAPVHRAPEETPPVVGSQTRPHGASRTGRGK
jgi:hypothetical protein